MFDDLSVKATTSLAGAFSSLYENAGAEGVKYLQDFMNQLDEETAF
jgi:hypothetical protein